MNKCQCSECRWKHKTEEANRIADFYFELSCIMWEAVLIFTIPDNIQYMYIEPTRGKGYKLHLLEEPVSL